MRSLTPPPPSEAAALAQRLLRPPSRTPVPSAPEPLATSFKERLAICRACPERRDIVGGMMQCTKCGCVCNFKAAIQRASCPIGKW